MKKIAILGSTGSIGQNALAVARHLGKSEVEVVGLCASSNIDLLEIQAKEFSPKVVAVYDKTKALALQKKVPHIPVLGGMEGVCEVASASCSNLVIAAINGALGLKPTALALACGKEVGFASKEVLVAAGKLITDLAYKHKAKLIPIDSELTALFQCLKGESSKTVNRLLITASGGPFRGKTTKELSKVSPADALKHPNYAMGAKVTIDSSTLMNKGLEMIEAHFLFSMPVEKIEVLVHKEQIIHSAVEFCDGSILAQMGEPDMLAPIQYVMTYPSRKTGMLRPFDFVKYSPLTFAAPDTDNFPCLKIAYEAIRSGKSYPCYMNGVNEVLVQRFLQGEISWHGIAKGLQTLLATHIPKEISCLEEVEAITELAFAEGKAFIEH